MTIRVGTCSWTDRITLNGGVKPTPEQALRLYAARLTTVEVDSTFYAPLSERNSQLWAQRTPPNFTFHLKTFRLLTTHGADPNSLPADIRRSLRSNVQAKRFITLRDVDKPVWEEIWQHFREALEPLRRAGKLGLVLMQFPPSFDATGPNAEYLISCKEMLSGLNLAVEFRSRTWFAGHREETMPAWLEDNDIAMVCVDTPQGLASSIPALAVATTSNAYVRLHGRNAATWGRPGKSENNYWYSETELRELLDKVRLLEQQSETVYVLFNTIQGLPNSLEFLKMISPDTNHLEGPVGSHPADLFSQLSAPI